MKNLRQNGEKGDELVKIGDDLDVKLGELGVDKGNEVKVVRSEKQLMKRANVIAKQVISIQSALSLGFVSQLWVDTNTWMVVIVEVRPNILSGEQEMFFLEDIRRVGDVVLVEDETVMDKEFKMVGLETLVGYSVVTPGRRDIGKVRGYTFNINTGAIESLELDSFGISIIPSSLVSTYALLVEDVLEVVSDTVVVHDAAASRIQRPTKVKMGEQAPMMFKDLHNQAVNLINPPENHRLFKSMIVGLDSCRLSHALRMNPVVYSDLIKDFWETASLNKNGANGAETIEAKIQNTSIIISESVIREVLAFGDKPEHPIKLSKYEILRFLPRLSYEGDNLPLSKKLLHPYWRYLAHVLLQCICGNKGGIDTLSHIQTSALVALVMDWDYNFSKLVFEEMKGNLRGVRKEMFYMYPRFLQMIFDDRYPNLQRGVDHFDTKVMWSNTFGLMMQNRKGKTMFRGLIPLVKFGRFPETEQDLVVEPVIQIQFDAVVDEEHDAEIVDAPEIEVEVDNIDLIKDEDAIYEDPLQEAQTAQPSVHVASAEQLAAVLVSIQRSVGNPSSSSSTVPEHQVTHDDIDTGFTSRKRRRLDSRRGVLITSSVTKPQEPQQQAPHTREPTSLPTDTQAGSSSQGATGDDFDYDDSQDVPISTERLQQRVFKLEQESVSQRLKIHDLETENASRDLKIHDLETKNAEQDVKIQNLENELGHLSALFFDLKHKLEKMFGDDNDKDRPPDQGASGPFEGLKQMKLEW